MRRCFPGLRGRQVVAERWVRMRCLDQAACLHGDLGWGELHPLSSQPRAPPLGFAASSVKRGLGLVPSRSELVGVS